MSAPWSKRLEGASAAPVDAMNFYSHHLGDHIRRSAHLSVLEEGALRRLLDAYYIREAALPADSRECCRLVRAASKAELLAVDRVLTEFFVLAEDGYHNSRADEEIARVQAKGLKAKDAAHARWMRTQLACERNANASEVQCGRNASQEPITNNQEKHGDTWWKTNEGIDRKAREMGIEARPRETYHDFKQRLFAQLNGGQA